MERACKICGARFTTNSKTKRYCRRSCKRLAEKQKAKSNTQIENAKGKESIVSRINNIKLINAPSSEVVYQLKVKNRVRDLLIFTHAIFWPEKTFSEVEQESLLHLIEDHFQYAEDPDKLFKQLVECTVVEKCHLGKKPYWLMLEPAEWFHKDCIDGLAATKWANDRVRKQMEQDGLAEYLTSMPIFTEAVLKYSQNRNILDFYSYREQFSRLGFKDLLPMFMQFMVHIHFLNF